jgi:ubiquinone/menaquinone biosynthesis C-methylase UbiE
MAHESGHQLSGIEAMRTLTEAFTKELDPAATDRLLDVGTGSGRFAPALCKLVPCGFVTGIDPARDRLRAARDAIVTHRVPNLELAHGRAETLPFASEVFDSACLMFSLHHFADPEKSLGEIRRVLKKGGHLVSVDPVLKEPSDEDEERLNEAIGEAFQQAHGPEHRFFTAADLRRLYQQAGFSIEACRTYDIAFRQVGVTGIPQGPHWLQAYNLLRLRRQEGLLQKFEQDYFSFREEAGQLLVEGKTTWAVIRAAKG